MPLPHLILGDEQKEIGRHYFQIEGNSNLMDLQKKIMEINTDQAIDPLEAILSCQVQDCIGTLRLDLNAINVYSFLDSYIYRKVNIRDQIIDMGNVLVAKEAGNNREVSTRVKLGFALIILHKMKVFTKTKILTLAQSLDLNPTELLLSALTSVSSLRKEARKVWKTSLFNVARLFDLSKKLPIYGGSPVPYFLELVNTKENCEFLRAVMFKNEDFRTTLITDVSLPDLLINGQYNDIYTLCLLASNDPRLLSYLLSVDTLRNAILNHPNMHTALFKINPNNTSTMYFLSNPHNLKNLKTFLANSILKRSMLESPQLITALLAQVEVRQQQPNEPQETTNSMALQNLDIDVFIDFSTNKTFKTNLFDAYNLTRSFFDRNRFTKSNGYNASILYRMIIHFSKTKAFLIEFFKCMSFALALGNGQAPAFVEALFLEVKNNSDTQKNAFTILFIQDKDREVVNLLFRYHFFKKALVQFFDIPLETESLFLSIFSTEEGVSLINVLIQLKRTSCLKQRSLIKLFTDLQLQQLIQLELIKPEWFLFIALHSNDPENDVPFFLNQPTISPWVTDASGRYFHHLIEEAKHLPENQKAVLTQHFKTACWRHANAQSVILSSDKTTEHASYALADYDDSANTADSSRKRPHLDEQADSGNISDIFNAYIRWILSQHTLEPYHTSFNELSQNKAILKPDDFKAITHSVQRLVAAMQARIKARQDIPSFNSSWSLNTCSSKVMSSLEDMRCCFEHNVIKHYQNNTVRYVIAQYESLFAVDRTMEAHAPETQITALLGREPAPPHYDPYLMRWTTNQCRWVAKNVAFSQLHAKPWLRQDMLRPIIESFINSLADDLRVACQEPAIPSNFTETTMLLINEVLVASTTSFERLTPRIVSATSAAFANQSVIINIGEITGDESKWSIFLNHLNGSKLMEVANIEKFFTLLGFKIDSIELKLNIENSHQFIINFMEMLEDAFDKWFEAQQTLPQPKEIMLYSELIWLYLTDSGNDGQRKKIDSLLIKLPDAIDAAALIKFTITQHQHDLEQLRSEQLFKPIPNHNLSLFSLLISNPLDAAWTFETQIRVSKVENNIELEFKETSNQSGLKRFLAKQENKQYLEEALEKAIAQPGTLFFWLYYLHQDEARNALFFAILKFLLSSINCLYQYDSLLPVLRDMQCSKRVNNEQKVLVTSFLSTRLDQMLQTENYQTYWSTTGFLHETDLSVMHQRIISDKTRYPGLPEVPKQLMSLLNNGVNLEAAKAKRPSNNHSRFYGPTRNDPTHQEPGADSELSTETRAAIG